MKINNSIIHYVQYYETDQMGVVHHANYVRWMEEARKAFLKSVGIFLDKLDEEKVYMAVLFQSVEYIKSVKYDEKIEVRCNCTKIDNVKVDFSYEFYNIDNNYLCAKGKTSHCFVDDNLFPIVFKKRYPEAFTLLQKEINTLEK